jgi:hypothetical protein
MKPLDELIKEEIDEGTDLLLEFIENQHILYDYDKEEMIEYVIKKLKEIK